MRFQGVAALAAFVAAQSVSVPNLTVPNFRDLTIKTRRSHGEAHAAVMTETLLLRGTRQRREWITRRPGLGEPDGDTNAIRETTRHTEDGETSVAELQLLEFSEAPLDAGLFEVP